MYIRKAYCLADLQSDATILALIPTIVGLFALPSMDIIPLAIRSSHMGLASCIFGINIPGGILRNLRNHSDEEPHLDVKLRHWHVKIHLSRCPKRSYLLELACLMVPGIYFWRLVSKTFHVTFRPESYREDSGVVWLLIAIAVLLCVADVGITEGIAGGKKLNWFHFFVLKSRGPPPHILQRLGYLKDEGSKARGLTTSSSGNQPQSTASSNSISATAKQPLSENKQAQPIASSEPQSEKLGLLQSLIPIHYVLTITTRMQNGLAYYQTSIDVCAMIIYLDGTVVFASVIFVPSAEAMLVLFPLAGAQIPMHFMARRWAPRLIKQLAHEPSDHPSSMSTELPKSSGPTTPMPQSKRHDPQPTTQPAPQPPGDEV